MFTALEQSAFSTWLLESNSIWAYPTVLTLHTFGMMMLVGSALIVDLRLLGFGRALPLESIDRLFSIMWAAFALNAVSGSMLFAADAAKLATELQFWTKLVLVAIGLCTAVLIRRGSFRAGMEPVVITGAAKRLAVVSLLAWSAAVTAGRLLAYVG